MLNLVRSLLFAALAFARIRRDIALNVHARAHRWLRRRGFVEDSDEPDFNNESPKLTTLDSCLQGSLGLGKLTSLPGVRSSANEDDPELLPRPTKAARRGGRHRGFDVDAGVVVSATDRAGRERLLRYCARPPLSLQRLSLTPEGMVACRLRNPWRPNQTHRMTTGQQRDLERITSGASTTDHRLLSPLPPTAPAASTASTAASQRANQASFALPIHARQAASSAEPPAVFFAHAFFESGQQD